jgi:hypothetical protein
MEQVDDKSEKIELTVNMFQALMAQQEEACHKEEERRERELNQIKEMFMSVIQLKEGAKPHVRAFENSNPVLENAHIEVGTSERSSESEKSIGSRSSMNYAVKELLWKSVDFNGEGGLHALLEFIEKWEACLEVMDWSPLMELKMSVNKLTGMALIWWRSHTNENGPDSPKRIRTWKGLKSVLIEQFTSPDHGHTL